MNKCSETHNVVNFCKQCNTYVCEPCMTQHSLHPFVSIHSLVDQSIKHYQNYITRIDSLVKANTEITKDLSNSLFSLSVDLLTKLLEKAYLYISKLFAQRINELRNESYLQQFIEHKQSYNYGKITQGSILLRKLTKIEEALQGSCQDIKYSDILKYIDENEIKTFSYEVNQTEAVLKKLEKKHHDQIQQMIWLPDVSSISIEKILKINNLHLHISKLIEHEKAEEKGKLLYYKYPNEFILFEPSEKKVEKRIFQNCDEIPYSFDMAHIGSNLVLMSGGQTINNTFLNHTYLLDLEKTTITKKCRMSMEKMWHTLQYLDNGKVMSIGGYSYCGATSSCEIYNIQDDTWEKTGALSECKCYCGTCLYAGRTLYCIGGRSDDVYYSTIEQMDFPIAYYWKISVLNPDCMMCGRGSCGCTQLKDCIIILGGNNGKNLSDCFIFNPIKLTVESSGFLNMPDMFYRCKPKAIGDSVYALGYSTHCLYTFTSNKKWEIIEKII